MREILVIGEDCAAKNFVLISLHPFFKLVDLQTCTDLSGLIDPTIIYVCDRPDKSLFPELQEAAITLILIAKENSRLPGTHFFIANDFPPLSDKRICAEVQKLRLEISRFFVDRANLSVAQQLVFDQLVQGVTLKEAISNTPVSRAVFFRTLTNLRKIFGVQENCELIPLLASCKVS